MRIALKSVHGVFHNHFPGNLEELFGSAQSQAAAGAACKDDGDVSNHVDEGLQSLTKRGWSTSA